MNNKGFTLVEVLAVVVILAIIVGIAAPNISKEIEKSNAETSTVLREKIENAAHIYAGKYYADDIVGGSGASFSLTDIVNDGLLELKENECANYLNETISVSSDGSFDFQNIEDDSCYKENQKEE